jgi:hypothetical protein
MNAILGNDGKPWEPRVGDKTCHPLVGNQITLCGKFTRGYFLIKTKVLAIDSLCHICTP